ncbi:hypothetical protein FHS42_005266 [Streptomyces zagrosensis]|uniref:Uncharacterized protein n=1 Tax=Streptomyces zagrosensis TaxID=1042984 RepID=A0A7W9V0H3_9ACTN|nr:hypothetical protein [Streptomyces zagrosensis]MBB5938178.1 hypothetical protein [Streptomyces zagrosensis]
MGSQDLPLVGPQCRGGIDRRGDRILLAVAVLSEEVEQETIAGRIVGDVPFGQYLAASSP